MKRLIILFAAVAMWGCVSEPAVEQTDAREGMNRVQIKLSVPAAQTATRAVLSDAQQSQVQDLEVLVFTTGTPMVSKYVRRQPAELVAGQTDIYEMELPVGTWKFLFLANAKSVVDGAVGANELKPGITTFDQAMKQYLTVENHAPQWSTGESIPMSFLTEASLAIGQPHPFTGVKEVKMQRMVARVDVRFDAAITNFQLDEVLIFNAARSGTLVNSTYTVLPPTGQTIATATDRFATNTGTNNCTGQIFMFEQLADYNDKTNPQPYIGIKGRYTDPDGVETTEYYRIDFSKYGALFRNDRYAFIITEVLGKGYPAESDLATAKPINLAIQTFRWDDDAEGEFIVNDNEYLYVSGDNIQFEMDKEDQQFTVRTGVAGGFVIKDITYQDPADTGWLTLANAGTAINSTTKYGADNKSTLIDISVKRNLTGKIRYAEFLIKAGPLEKILLVRQLPLLGTFAPPGVLGVSLRTFQLTLRGSQEYKGTPLDTGEFGPIMDETVIVAHFKHGSTVAVWWSERGGTSLAWAPKGYAMAQHTTMWSDIIVPTPAQLALGNNSRLGFGDPCTYADGGLGNGKWRTPRRGYWLDTEFNQGPTAGIVTYAGTKMVISKSGVALPFNDYNSSGGDKLNGSQTSSFWYRDTHEQNDDVGIPFRIHDNGTSNSIQLNLAGVGSGTSKESGFTIRCVSFKHSPTLDYDHQLFPWEVRNIPMRGGIWSVWTSTNLSSARVQVYEGRDENDFSKLVTDQPIVLPAPLDAALTPQMVKTDITFGARVGAAERTLRFYLVSVDYNKGARTHIGTTFQESVDYTDPVGDNTAAPRITWDPNTDRFALTTTATEGALYFKFGSIVGLFSGSNGQNARPGQPGASGDTFDAGDIAWAPHTVAINGDFAMVPPYTIISGQLTPFPDNYNADVADKNGSLDPALHHTRGNILKGFGDPCRLVGLDLKVMLNGGPIDNKRWRTPTWAEYKTLIGAASETADPASRWATYNGVTGTDLPLTGTKQSFMPVSGVRTASPASGITQAVTSMGSYWTATKFWNTDQYEIDYGRWAAFTTTTFYMGSVTPLYTSGHTVHDAMAIRCIAQ